jgi:hypothetical protein
MGGYKKVLCKYYAILYKGLDHARILVWGRGAPGNTSPRILKDEYTFDYGTISDNKI